MKIPLPLSHSPRAALNFALDITLSITLLQQKNFKCFFAYNTNFSESVQAVDIYFLPAQTRNKNTCGGDKRIERDDPVNIEILGINKKVSGCTGADTSHARSFIFDPHAG